MDNLMKQQSVQERLNNSVEKLKEIFVSIAEPILEILSPIAFVVPLQFLAYYTAVERGSNPDTPRNLAKCVTVK
jgi:glucosamine--fructose-6-phosphate aminotransferase (isomerizing)